MAGSPQYKLYRDGEYVAAAKHAADAAALIAVFGCGDVRCGHAARFILWREGSEDFSAADSYDRCAAVINQRQKELREQARAAWWL